MIFKQCPCGVAAAVLALTVSGCAFTPHNNVMVFATSTKTAVDVSQEPTGTLSATIGYKRLEAVWMPLLANQTVPGDQKAGSVAPARCPDSTDKGDNKRCPLFQGNEGGNYDTYSVLGTFSGQASGVAGGATPGVEARGQIAQFFATGLAARALASPGGNAALFNTSASVDPKAVAVAQAQAQDQQREAIAGAADLVKKLRTADGSALDNKKFKQWTDALIKQPSINSDFITLLDAQKKSSEKDLTTLLEDRWARYGNRFNAAAKDIQ
jgi:hypothetical protein